MSGSSDHSPSLREALTASWDAAEAAAAPSPDTAAPAAPAASPSAPPEQSGQDGRQRDEHGRFAPGAADQPGEQGASQAAPAAPEIPEGYDPAVWGLMTPEAQAQTSAWAGKQRETVKERDARLERYKPLEDVLGPRRDALAAEYGSDAEGIRRLMQLSDFATRDPAGFVQFFAQTRRLDLSALAGQGQQAQQQPQQQADPRAFVQQLVQEQLQAADVDRAYNDFVADKSLEFRDHPGVKGIMASLLQSGQAPDYRAAYDMATLAHPETRPKRIAADTARTAQSDTERRAQAASKAAAASSVSGAPGTSRPAPGASPPSLSLRDTLAKNWDAMTSGGRA